jgi:hypothetical protein
MLRAWALPDDVTKRARIVAWLVQPTARTRTRKLDFRKRFGAPLRNRGPATDVLGSDAVSIQSHSIARPWRCRNNTRQNI